MNSTTAATVFRAGIVGAFCCAMIATAAQSQTSTTGVSVTGGSATGGSATGGSAVGGTAIGGTATGGSVSGSSVSGGTVRGGTATGGSATATGGQASAGTATSGTATPGTATATVGGRRISASSDSGVSIHTEGDHARVQVGTHLIVVEPDRVLLDGRERATLTRSEDLVQISNIGGKLTVRAGTTEVLTERLEAR
jgi:hypothetical protein